MSSKSVLTIGVTALLLVAGVLAVGLAAPASADSDPATAGNTTISVTASADTAVAPDHATVSLAALARAETADGARSDVAERAASLRAALADGGIEDDAVRTTGYTIRTNYEYRDGTREQRGYVATQSFEVDAPAVDRAGEVIDVAVASGATRVDGVQFGLSEARRATLRADVLTDAMDSARADADAIAAAADLTVTGVHSVSTTAAGYAPVFADAREASAGTVIDPGDVRVSASVSVVYLAD